MKSLLKKLGPGLLFAGAAIGVSHLVQSTKAGATFGFGLLWALLLVNLFKYPFFQYGTRYAIATGETLLEGYKKLGTWVLVIYYLLTFAIMFTIQAAVTIVTAGLATALFGDFMPLELWAVLILALSFLLLYFGGFNLLDNFIKIIIIILSISSILAGAIALFSTTAPVSFVQIIPESAVEITFLIAFMGWMPTSLDVSVWSSIWTVEKQKNNPEIDQKTALLDFNIGYIGTVILGFVFILLGTVIMYNSGEVFSKSGGVFAIQLIEMYTNSLGSWAYFIIGIAAFTTMLSTTVTCLDASPRAMQKATTLLFGELKKGYLIWMLFLAIGTSFIFFFLASEMGLLIKIATILSFLTAPFFAIVNLWLISSKHTPKDWHPSKHLKILSYLGIVFLLGFGIWYLTIL